MNKLKRYAAQHPNYMSSNFNIVINSCSQEVRLLISRAEEITSDEVTTQGNSTDMSIYEVESFPLLQYDNNR